MGPPSHDELETHLLGRFHSPLPVGMPDAARTAIDLTAAENADRLVEIEAGPAVPAGTIVEMLDLDRFVELA